MLSIEAVKSELEDPDASTWANANAGFFEPDDVSRLGEVSRWVMAQARFDPAQQASFLAKADVRLVGHALQRGYTIVTMEVAAPTSQKVKVPDVCSALGVRCTNTFQVLDELQARFVLEMNL